MMHSSVAGSAPRLLIFDLDGTLVHPASGEEFPQHARDWELLPGVDERVRRLHEGGVTCAIASNQGGVAFGYMCPEDASARVHAVARALKIGHVQMCFHHPEGTVDEWRMHCFFRKPSTGMLLAHLHAAGCRPAEALVVGDRPEDQEAAAAIPLAFQPAHVFFGREQSTVA